MIDTYFLRVYDKFIVNNEDPNYNVTIRLDCVLKIHMKIDFTTQLGVAYMVTNKKTVEQ